MAYISTDDVKHIRNTLKKEFPKYKFSVRRDSIYSVTVSFMKGPSFKDWEYRDRYTGEMKVGSLNDGEHHQINHFYTTDFYGIENAKILDKVYRIMKVAPALNGGKAWYDNSDAMTDYFDTAYYMHIEVGKWDKPYEIVDHQLDSLVDACKNSLEAA